MNTKETNGAVTIVGAGLCGSLLAIVLARRGLDVRLLERGADPRRTQAAAGRSINLALAARGIRALEYVNLFAAVEPLLVPMRGRMLHREDRSTELLPYGQRESEQIFSVSRAALNRLLIDAAEKDHGVSIRFHQQATGIDAASGMLEMHDRNRDKPYSLEAGPVIAADGAGSSIRRSLASGPLPGVTESLLPHGYRELTVPPGADGAFQFAPAALHVWPRGGFMLIALPNPERDFTLTLFLSNAGPNSFTELDSGDKVAAFFSRYFPDVASKIPNLSETFLERPTGILGTVRCEHWHDGGKVLLIGDAAHAIVPFHGQGMNLAFEDCVLLDRILAQEAGHWARTFSAFECRQRANANAIADMALENYVEMRDTVREPQFALQKALSFELERRLPGRFIPRYSMVMFHDEIPYAVAQQRGTLQQRLLDELTQHAESLEQIDIDAAVSRVQASLPPFASEGK